MRRRALTPIQAFTLIEVLAVIAIAVIAIAILLPTVRKIRDQAAEAKCTSNLRAIGPAFELYLQDNQRRLPYRFQPEMTPQIGYKEDLAPYLGGDLRVFKCPAHKKLDFPTQPSYGMNYFYDHALVARVTNFPGTILIAETAGAGDRGTHRAHRDSESPGQLAPKRHGGKSNYLFFDGSVRWLDYEETISPEDLWGVNPQKGEK